MTASTLATAITEEDHAQGPANAPVTLVQYGDYECPYTQLSRHSVHQLQREFSDSLRFVFRQKALEDVDLQAYAAKLGFDPERFDADRRSFEVAQRIRSR